MYVFLFSFFINFFIIMNKDQQVELVRDNNKSSTSEQIALCSNHIMFPEVAHMQYSTDSFTIPGRQASTYSQSTLEAGLHTFHPRLKSSIVWIDDEYKELNTLKEIPLADRNNKMLFLSLRGICNMVTMLFIIGLILFLFIYPLANK